MTEALGDLAMLRPAKMRKLQLKKSVKKSKKQGQKRDEHEREKQRKKLFQHKKKNTEN